MSRVRAGKAIDLASLDFTQLIKRGQRVTWGQGGAEPIVLTELLMAQRAAIGPFEVFLGASFSKTPDPAYADVVRFISYCGTGTNRNLSQAGLLDILPCPYSQAVKAILPVDVLMLQVAPAREGQFSFSIAHEYLVPLIDAAKLVIAEVNDQAPWTYGERMLSVTDFDYMVSTSRAPLALPDAKIGATDEVIARHLAGLVEDGSTLQLGIGGLPEAALRQLKNHRDLGIHSGTIGNGVAELIEAGVVTNARKSIDQGITVAGVMFGGPRIYQYAHANPAIRFRSPEYTHNGEVIARLDRFVALNSAIEVDLTGQINAEIAGGTYLGAVGGAGDFLRGAHRSRGGLPIVALPSTVGRNPMSKIVSKLSGPVSTARSDAGLIVTEHGIADLRGKSLRQRKQLMLDIAHPDFREALDRAPAED